MRPFQACIAVDAGPAVEDHAGRTAAELLAAALDALGLSTCHLSKLSKDDARKQAVAWLLRNRTSASNRWLSEYGSRRL